jgi:hypothetical protein
VRYLGPKELRDKGVPYHHNHLRRMWQDGRFPKPTYLSTRKLAWREDEIDNWLESRRTGEVAKLEVRS